MFLESRFERAIGRICANDTIPLRLKLWNGRHIDLSPAPTVTVTLPKASALRYFISPDLAKLGEAFVEGHIGVEGSIHEVFRVAEKLARRVAATTSAGFHRLAQMQKLDHILTKLMLKPGERFLDIGCGWGALVIRAAKEFGATATGITLSKNQFDYAREVIRREGLQGRCNVELCDYRDRSDTGGFDKIASVGMFEHVGLKNLPTYFAKIRALLKDKGLVLNHGITTSDAGNRWMGFGAGAFIDRYVLPDGELPHLSLVLKEMSVAGLEVTDVESLRRHYARTCHEWASRLECNRVRAAALTDEKRLRIWQIYLAGCAYGFANGWMNVYQVLGSHAENTLGEPLPLTRDYMYDS